MRSAAPGGCLSEETLCGFADGTLTEGRDEIEAHLAGCDRCSTILADLIVSARRISGEKLEAPPLQLERQVQGRELAARKARGVSSFFLRVAEALFTYRAAAAVATISVVALLAVWVNQSHRPPGGIPSGVREGGTTVQLPVLIEPRGEIAAEGTLRFLWEGCPGSERCVITILNADSGSVVVREAVSGDEYVLPVERLAQVGGEHFEWMVECTLQDGRLVLSNAVPFHLPQPALGE